MRTLVLNAGYEPLAGLLPTSIVLYWSGKGRRGRRRTNPVISESLVLPRPSVILLVRYVRVPHGRAVP